MSLSAQPVYGSLPSEPAAKMSTRQYGLDILRVLAICGVVAIHVFDRISDNDGLKGTAKWWAANGIHLGAEWAVPVFVMISGALVLDPRAHAAGPAAFYRRRFSRIIPAMIVWHVVYVVFVRMAVQGESISTAGLASMFIDARWFTALYFLWLIAGLYVIAPVLAAFLENGGADRARVAAVVALGWTLVVSVIPGVSALIDIDRPLYLGSLNMWWPYVGYFLMGWALRNVTLGKRGTWIAALVAVAALAEMLWQVGTPSEKPLLRALLPVGYLGSVVAILAISVFLVGISVGARVALPPRAARALVILSDASFGVFLVHLLILVLVRYWVPTVAAGVSMKAMLVTYVAVLTASFAVSIGAARLRYLRALF